MPLTIVQIILTAGGCLLLWRLWSRFSRRDRRIALIVGGGLLLRALGAQALFWTSYLGLPIGRSLQLGGGFWFFGYDGTWYFRFAHEVMHGSPLSIYPSPLFVRILSSLFAAFGSVPSASILLNCAAYLATCEIIIRLGTKGGRADLPCLAALAAVAFGPGTILWSLQPLKDTFFLLLIAAMIGACFWWQNLWTESDLGKAWRQLLLSAAAMLWLTWAIGAIRWYVAAIIWAGWAVFCVLVALRAPRRAWALPANVVLFVLLAQASSLGGGSDVSAFIRPLLDPRPKVAVSFRPSAVSRLIEKVRSGFDRTPGATTIAAGPALEGPQSKSASAPGVGTATKMPAPSGATSDPSSLAKPPVTRSEAVASHTLRGRIVAGFAAMFLPRAVGESLGLIHVGGGRGLWFFAEADTLAFDVVLLFGLTYCTRTLLRSPARATPLFVLLVLVFVIMAAPMMYTVSNFGTLIRLRQMVYFIAAMLPVTLARAPESNPPGRSDA